jgi:GH25 family lysozyme M1 (1,4-beta-N-acetylmuramidase)
MTAIDISYFQGHPDFAQVKAAGVGLVIMKAVDVERGYPVMDSVYVANRTAARAQGLAVGSYLFNGPDDPTSAANYYFSVIDWRSGDIAAIDVENALGVNRWNPAQVHAFCVTLIGHGIPAASILAYMSSSVTRAYDWSPVMSLGVGLWVAQYGSNNGTPQGAPATGTWGSWKLWQYSSTATVPGISGHVDINQLAPGFSGGVVTPINSEEEDMKTIEGIYAVVDGVPSWAWLNWATGAVYSVFTQKDADWINGYMGNVEIEVLVSTAAISASDQYKQKLGLLKILCPPASPADTAAIITGIVAKLPASPTAVEIAAELVKLIPVSSATDLTPVLTAIAAIPVPPAFPRSGTITLT